MKNVSPNTLRVTVNGKALPTWQAALLMIGAFVVMLGILAILLPFVAFLITFVIALAITLGLAGALLRLINGRWPGFIQVHINRK
ncbi:MAG: hypothetical protein WAZ18_02985 [Alphaproteobacteria bacterium]